MSTIALKSVAAKQAAAKRVETKEDRTHLLTERLRRALEDVEEGRVHTIESENHREGFKKLIASKRAVSKHAK